MNVQPSPIAIAREYWGSDLPQWVELLAGECMQSSQNKVAKALDVSPTMISQVLRAKYPGDMQRLEDVFRGVFLSATVDCPARGPLPAQDCYKWRDRARIKEGTIVPKVNMEQVQMFRACNKCPRNPKAEHDHAI